MTEIMYLFGLGVVAVVAETVLKEMGKTQIAHWLGIATVIVAISIVLRFVRDLIDTVRVFG